MENDLFIFNNFVADVNELRKLREPTRVRRQKVYKKRLKPMEGLSAYDFRLRYGFTKENIMKIIELIRPDLQVDSRGGAIPVELQVMAAISYWVRHEKQEDCAEMHGMSQQTLSNLARRVAITLASKSQQYIKMPSNNTEKANVMHKFEAICGFQGIIGAIDETQIKTRKFCGDLGQYHVKSKEQYSVIVQVVCDSDLIIRDIMCHCRSTTLNTRIYSESSIMRRFEENEFSGRLIGDSSYPCSSYLITPIQSPKSEEELRFNHCHIQTRNVVEKCIHMWKQRFRVLLVGLRGSYNTIKTTIVACAVLHNLSIMFNEVLDTSHSTDNIFMTLKI